VLATLLGGPIALRLIHSLPTVMALTGGVVVAVALLDVLPEGIDSVGDPHDVRPLVAVGFLGFFFARAVLVLHHRDDSEERAPHGVGVPRRARPLAPQLHRRARDRPRLRRRLETGFLVLLAVVSHDFADGLNTVSFVLSQSATAAGEAVAADRRTGAARGRDRRLADLASRADRSATSSASTAGFFLYYGSTDCCPRPTRTASAQVGLDRVASDRRLRGDLRRHGIAGGHARSTQRQARCHGTVAGRVSTAKKSRSKAGRRTANERRGPRSSGRGPGWLREQQPRVAATKKVAEAHHGGAEVDRLEARQAAGGRR
jgi:ZIP family zinc transporter